MASAGADGKPVPGRSTTWSPEEDEMLRSVRQSRLSNRALAALRARRTAVRIPQNPCGVLTLSSRGRSSWTSTAAKSVSPLDSAELV